MQTFLEDLTYVLQLLKEKKTVKYFNIKKNSNINF